MTLAVPNPSTAAAGAKQTATTWNTDVRDAVLYLLQLQGGLGRRNFLKNSDFALWQRGTSFAIAASTKTYTADRWVAYRTATGSTVSRQAGPPGQAYALRYQRNSGDTSTAAMRLIQALPTENSLGMAGKSCSVRVGLAAGANFSAAGSTVNVIVTYGTGTDQSPEAAWTGSTDALTASQVITTTATEYTFDNIVIPTNATQVKVEVNWTPVGTAGANDWVQPHGLQISVGSMAGFEQIPPEQNKAECHPFYQQIGPYGATAQYVTAGMCTSTTGAILVLNYPTKRTSPTITFSAINDFAVMSSSGSSVNSTNIYTSVTSPDAARLVAITASGLSAGNATLLTTAQDPTNAAIYIDAEL